MIDLAIAFAWAWGLRDHQTASAIGLSEAETRQRRMWMGLRKGGYGRPVRDDI